MNCNTLYISILALVVSIILPIIGIYKFFIDRKIYADIQDEYERDDNGDHYKKAIIVLSTKGSSPIYYTDYRVIKKIASKKPVALINIEDIPPDMHPGVILNNVPEIIKSHGLGSFPNEIDGKRVKYEIELMITGSKKTKIIPLGRREWSKAEYQYLGDDQVEFPFDENE